MAKARILNIVATECEPKNEAKFNKWYNEIHVPMLMKYKGIKKVTRYKIMNEKAEKPRYITIYEYDNKESLAAMQNSKEFKDAIQEMQDTWKGEMFEIKWAINCEPLKTWGS